MLERRASRHLTLPLTGVTLTASPPAARRTVLAEATLSVESERDLVALAVALGAETVEGLSDREARLLKRAARVPRALERTARSMVRDGLDPLGDAYCVLRSADTRRTTGSVFTPSAITATMLDWATTRPVPERVVEPGSGSGRFLCAAGHTFDKARLIGCEIEPLAALLSRANLAARGLADRSEVQLRDFRDLTLPPVSGPTLYIGNPPYVRHHLISARWKAWLKSAAHDLGHRASTLAGLHVHFFLAIARRAVAGDYGALITSAEWLDVNYGQLVRDLFLEQLGGESLLVIDPEAEPFPGTAVTAAITTFAVATRPAAPRFTRVESLSELRTLSAGEPVSRKRLAAESRWSRFVRRSVDVPEGFIELGELCRVHRGAVTGANRVWIAGPHSNGLPASVLFPAITKAREIISAGWKLEDNESLRRVIDLPEDLSGFAKPERRAIDRFLQLARRQGVTEGYVAQSRRKWYAVGLRAPAPILATYMARRPPSFVLNDAEARHINIAHGLYPREKLAPAVLTGLVKFLRGGTTISGGRTYAGGLTKFEPREMERIAVPNPTVLASLAAS